MKPQLVLPSENDEEVILGVGCFRFEELESIDDDKEEQQQECIQESLTSPATVVIENLELHTKMRERCLSSSEGEDPAMKLLTDEDSMLGLLLRKEGRLPLASRPQRAHSDPTSLRCASTQVRAPAGSSSNSDGEHSSCCSTWSVPVKG